MHPRLLLLALVALALAGCQSQGPDAEATVPGAPEVEVDSDSPLGAISCVIVDETITPVGGAVVALVGTEFVASTADDGACVFSDVTPGAYFLQVSAPGYFSTQQEVDVKAGEVTLARVALQSDPAPRPYVTSHKFEGFMDLQDPLAAFVLDIVLEAATGDAALCDCMYRFTADSDTVAFVYEAVWEPNLENPAGEHDLYYEMFPTNNASEDAIQSAFLESPILVHIDRDAAWGSDDGEFTARLSGGATWVSYQQEFTVYISEWPVAMPPAGWSFVAGDVGPE